MNKRAKKINLKQLYQIVYNNRSITKPEISKGLGISLTAISDYINQLQEKGLLVSHKKGKSTGGRRPLLYMINREYRYIIGINIRESHFYIFLVDLYASIIHSEIIYLNTHEFSFYVNKIIATIKSIIFEYKIEKKIVAIGISISGITDFDNKYVERSNQLDWTARPLAGEIEQTIKIPVFIETDVRVFAYNEIEYDNPVNIAVILYLGKGIGLSLIIKNEIFQGYTNKAGDNRFFGKELKELVDIIKEDQYIQEINAQPYYSEKFRKEKIIKLSHKYKEYIQNSKKNRQQLTDFTAKIADLMIAMTNIINPKKILMTGNIFDYNDLIYYQVRDKIITSDKMSFVPEIKQNQTVKHPLEEGIVKMVMDKFFKLNEFEI